jgi:hypothetical protein
MVVAEAAEFVGDLSPIGGAGVVLEGVGVHGIEADAALAGVLHQGRRVLGIVPGDVKAHRAVGAGEGVQRRDVVDLLLGADRLAAPWKAAEAGGAGPQRPGRTGDAESRERAGDRLCVAADSRQDLGCVLEVGAMGFGQGGVLFGDAIGCDHGASISAPGRDRSPRSTVAGPSAALSSPYANA